MTARPRTPSADGHATGRSGLRNRVHRPPGAFCPGGDIGVGPDLSDAQSLYRRREAGVLHQPDHPALAHPEHVHQLGHGHQLRLPFAHRATVPTRRRDLGDYTIGVLH